MARLSPSPSSSSRRLSELLEEQQEPFSLDLYLLEKGVSPSLFDAAGGGATSTCWPRSSSVSSQALRRPAASKKTPASSLLRLLLSKILRGTAPLSTKKKKLQQPVAIDWDAVDREKQKSPAHFEKAAPLSPPPRRFDGAVEADMEEEEEEDDDDESSKQLSPVSVLEQRPFEQGPPAYAQKAMVIFRELLVAAYTPTLLDQLAEDSSSSKSRDGRNGTSTATPAAPTRTTRTASVAHWEETFEAELAKVHDLIASELAGARVGPEDVRPERRDVGVDVAAAVLEALTEEVAVELMGDGP